MQSGLYHTTLAATRCSSVFKVSCLVKMTDRFMRSSPKCNSLNSRKNLDIADNEGAPPKSWNALKLASDEEFPSLSASISMPKSKRRTRVDLGASSEENSAKVVQTIDPSQFQASTSVSQEDKVESIDPIQLQTQPSINHKQSSCLPTSSWKKPVSSWKPHKPFQECGEAKTSSACSPVTKMDECFDICFPDSKKFNASKRSACGKSREMWVPKVESAGEDGWKMKNYLDFEHSVEETGVILRPGMVFLKSYIPLREQAEIVKRCREFGCGPGGFYRPGYNDGAKLRLHMMCLGLDWNAQTRKYGKRREHDNAAPAEIPSEFTLLVNRALDDCHAVINRDLKTTKAEEVLPRMSPDVCIVNFYTTNGRLGLHQDRDESRVSLKKGLPVVSLSIGDSAEFLYGDERDTDKAESVLLESGDVLVFGGESRHVFHGVTTIYPNTAPRVLREISGLRPGRLNLTFRKY